MLTITKDKSTLIKGIVILMMVWLHLFNKDHTDLCECLVYICGEPLAKWLSNACGPVSFFLLLSGYGLAYTYDKGKLSLKGQARRIIKLYAHYWVVLAVFLTIGHFMMPDTYPGTVGRLLLNGIVWEYSYNYEMWFLFPYCMVALASPAIFWTLERTGMKKSVLLTGIFYVAMCFIISRYGPQYLYNNILLLKIVVFYEFLYPFTIGAVLYRTNFKLNSRLRPVAALVCIAVLVGLVSAFGNSIVYMAYVPLLVFLLCQLTYPKWMERMLMELGRKSMVIWMVHTWYCCYLFQPQVYALRYPIAIFVGTVLISYLTAIPVMWVTRKGLEILKL